MSGTSSPVAGSVRSDEVLTIGALETRFGWGVHALRSARRNGLKVRRVGKRSFVLGADVLQFIERQGRIVQ